MASEELKTLLNMLTDTPAEYLKAYEREHGDLESSYINVFNECLDRYISEYVDSCVDIDDIYWHVTDDMKISFDIHYGYDCEEFPYDQTDVDEFSYCHMKFSDRYIHEIDLKDKDIAEVIKEIVKDMRVHVEFEVEHRVKEYIDYDPRDEYVHPEERYPNKR